MEAIIFDTETNDRDNAEIIEAAWCKLEWGSPTKIPQTTAFDEEGEVLVETVHVLRFQPTRPITLGAMATHHIMDEDLAGCDPSATFVIPKCDYAIGHNIDFDMTAAGAMESGIKRIDTCSLARSLWPDLDSYSQSALLYFLDRQNARETLKNAHSAAADVLICKTILDAIIDRTASKSWEELWNHSEQARTPTVIAFGKHKGTPIANLPRDYKQWLLRATDPPIDKYLRIAIERTNGKLV
jgi:exodeoxyribonuclease X